MTALEVWNVLRRRGWVIVLVAVVAGATALAYSLSQTPIYRAHAELVVLPNRADWGLSMYLEARMRTFRSVILSFPQTEPDLPADLGDRVHVQLATEEGRIVIEVDDSDPGRAAQLANTLAGRLQKWVDANAPTVGSSRIYVQLLLPAAAPGAPSSPRYKLNTAAGLVLGGALGLPLAFLWDFLDDRLGDAARAAARLGIPAWPALPLFPPDRVAPWEEPDGEVAAAFQRLYTQLRLAGAEGEGRERAPWHTLVVMGVTGADLPPVLLTNLGVAIVQGGSTVLLVDGDMQRPALHEPFGLPASPGLSELLRRGEQLALSPAAAGPPGLYLLPAGESLTPAAQSATLQRAARALPALAQAAEIVLVRTPSALESPEGLFLAAGADAVLLVARAGRTRGRDVQRARQSLENAQARVIGLALWQEGKRR